MLLKTHCKMKKKPDDSLRVFLWHLFHVGSEWNLSFISWPPHLFHSSSLFLIRLHRSLPSSPSTCHFLYITRCYLSSATSLHTPFFLCNAALAFLHSADFTQLSMLTWNVMFPFLLWNCQLSLRMLSAHLPQCWNPLCSSESQHLICPHIESKQRVYTMIK